MRALVLGGMALIAATYGMARFGYGLFLPALSDEFGLTPGGAGLVQAGSFLSYCCAAAVAARMSRHPRAGVASAGAAAAIGSAGVALAPGAAVLAASAIVAGAGAGFATPALVALVQRAVPPAREERAQTTVNAGTGAGIVVAALLLVVAGEHWRLAWAAIAALTAASSIAVLRSARGLRDEPGRVPQRRARSTLRPLAAPLAAALLAGASSAGVWTFGSTVLAQAQPLGPGSPVVAWLVLGAAGVAGAWAARIVQSWSLRTAWSATTLTMVAATLALGLAPGAAPVALAAAAAFGASYTALSGVLLLWAARIDAGRAAQGAVALFIALAIGQAAGAAAVGALVGARPAVAFAVAAAIGVLALLPAHRALAADGSPRSRPRRSSGRRPRATTPSPGDRRA